MIIPDSQFDAAAQSVAQPDTDPLDRAASQVAGDQKVQLRASLYSSLMANPDMAARAQRLGRKTGLPGDVVERNLPEVERSAALNDIDRALERSPALAQWLADPKNARVAHDDVPQMGAIESAARYLFSHPGSKNTLMGDIGAGVFMASRGFAGVFRAGAEAAAPALDFFERPDIGSPDRAPVPFLADLPGGNPLRRLAEGFDRGARDAGAFGAQLSPPTSGIVQGGVSSGVKSLVNNVLALPLAFLPGGQPAYLTAVTTGAGGQSYQKAREKVVGPTTALVYGASDAVIEYGT